MSRLVSQQAFKALRYSIHRSRRNTLYLPFRYLLGSPRAFSHQGDSSGTLYSGHNTIARRFSSYPNPVNFYAVPSLEKTAHPGGFVEIHDPREISNPEVNKYDVLVSDISEDILRTEVPHVFGVDYLAEATVDDAKKVDVTDGYLYGDGRRAMAPCVVHNGENDKAYWVHFFVDPGSPATFLSEKVNFLACTESITNY